MNSLNSHQLRGGTVIEAHQISQVGSLQEAGMLGSASQTWSTLISYAKLFAGLLKKHILWVIASLVLGITLAVVSTLLTVPQYRAAGSLQIEPEQGQIATVEQFAGDAVRQDSQAYLQTQYGLLRSRALAERVANRLGANRVVGEIEGLTPVQMRKVATDRLVGGIRVNPVTGSRIVNLEFEDADPALAADVVNLYVEEFIDSSLDRKFDTSSFARRFLEERLQTLRSRIETTERELVAYAEQSDLIPAEGGNTRAPDPALANLVEAQAKATQDRIALEQRLVSMRANASSLPEVVSSPIIQNLSGELTKARADYSERRAVFGPEYPGVAQLAARIRTLEQQLGAETSRLAATYINGAQGAERAAREVEAELEQAVTNRRALLRNEDRRAIEYNILKRELDTNKSLYDGLLQRYREIGIAGGVGVSAVSLVDKALVPEAPVRPQPFINLAFGLIGGFGLAVAILLLLENWNQTIRTPDEVQRRLGQPLIGVVPKFEVDTDLLTLLRDLRSAASEAYYSIRVNLEFSRTGGLPSSLIVTSSRPNEGKSTTSIGIAAIVARTGKRVLLVDGDMRDPSIHKMLGLRNLSGLSTLLAGEADLASTVNATAEPNLFVVTAGLIPGSAAALLGGVNARSVISQMEAEFDLVVVDAPPLLGLADAPIISRLVQSTLYIVGARSANRPLIERSIARLRAAGSEILGVILTKFDPTNESHLDYDYGSSYGGTAYTYGAESETKA